MLKRIAPRCDRQYTFYDSNGEFTLRPKFVDNNREIVFSNVVTRNDVKYTLSEFTELYENNLIREVIVNPPFLRNSALKQSEKFYAVARGRVDFFITNKSYLCWNAVWEFDGAWYQEFDNFGDALDFLREIDERLPESARFIESSLTDNEMKIIQYYRKLSKAEKRDFRESLDIYDLFNSSASSSSTSSSGCSIK